MRRRLEFLLPTLITLPAIPMEIYRGIKSPEIYRGLGLFNYYFALVCIVIGAWIGLWALVLTIQARKVKTAEDRWYEEVKKTTVGRRLRSR